MTESLGYYINPLFNVLLGVVVLGERLGKIQWVAIGIAAIGVGVIALASSGVPWISLIMASSFAVYALIKKKIGRRNGGRRNGVRYEWHCQLVPKGLRQFFGRLPTPVPQAALASCLL